jgi:glycosyltransferase involved in cell wall biosynthesis
MKLGIFSTHPIQYQVPIWRKLAENHLLEAEVLYFSDQGVHGNFDTDFGEAVSWDIPLLDGYQYEFIAKDKIDRELWFKIPDISSFLERKRFDVVLIHGYMHRFERQLVRASSRFGYRVVLRGEFSDQRKHSFNWRRYPRYLYLRWFYGRVDHFCPIGIDALNHLKSLGIPEERMTLSPYSVDDAMFESQNLSLDKSECRANLRLPDDHIVYLFSGKLIDRKNPLLLANALIELNQHYSNFSIVYLGSGQLEDELSNMLSPVLGDRFISPGFVNQRDLGQFFKSADVFVLPSRFDTWGLVVNEAMHFGLPCVVSDKVGSGRDLIEEGVTGFVFQEGNLLSLTQMLTKYLEDTSLAKTQGRNAHVVIQNYTVEKTVQGIESAIFQQYATGYA